MARKPTWIAVVAGMLADGRGHFLMQQRPPGKRHAGLWEFPGGKVEPHESPRAALVRELNEELGIVVSVDGLEACAFAESPPGGDDPGIVIMLYRVRGFAGNPAPGDGAAMGWFTLDAIARLPLPPLDADLLRTLRAGGR